MKIKALIVAGAVVGGVFATAAPAAAYCNQVFKKLTGACSECSLVNNTAREAGVETGLECVE